MFCLIQQGIQTVLSREEDNELDCPLSLPFLSSAGPSPPHPQPVVLVMISFLCLTLGLTWILYILSNCPPERLYIFVYFNSFLCSFVTMSHFSPLSLFLDFFFLSTVFFNKILVYVFPEKEGKAMETKNTTLFSLLS